jgi:hypothetical protein
MFGVFLGSRKILEIRDRAIAGRPPDTLPIARARHAVREILAIYVFAVIGWILFLDQQRPGISEDHHVFPALVAAAVIVLPVWLLYRFIAFAAGF